MKILHTADWHLGKNLEGQSRLQEQEAFLTDFIKLTKERDPDLIIIAGDIYDTFSPPAKAEILFYNTLKDLSEQGKRLILIIAGNHDSPDRLVAAGPLAKEHGIIMLGTPKSTVDLGFYGQHEVIRSEPGVLEVQVGDERSVILTIPFPSEKRLNEVIYHGDDEEEHLQSYEDRMKMLFEDLEVNFRDDTINLMVSHLFVFGSEESGSERSIQLGGSYLINSAIFPRKAQYIALGHIHKPQTVPGSNGRARYSGSPIHYNKNEIHFSKSINWVEVSAGQEAIIEKIPLPVYKPIEVWRCNHYREALEKCETHKDRSCWVYLEILTETYIKEDEIKQLKSLKKDILSIRPMTPEEIKREEEVQAREEQSFEELFKAFYHKERGLELEEETFKLLMQVLQEGDANEAD